VPELRWKAVVFDLDGTLIDTIPLIVASHRHAVTTVLGRDFSDDVLRSGIGRPLIDQMRVFDEPRAQELFDTYRVWNHANTAALLGRFDGVDDVLVRLAAAGAAIGVATSKSRDAVDLAFSIQPPVVGFQAIVTVEDSVQHKPHPEPVLTAIARLGAEPADAVYVGDAPYDIEAAVAAGCGAVGVTWGVATAGVLAAAGADAVAETPAELATILLGDG
jgi:pyrophosphatase PpaX